MTSFPRRPHSTSGAGVPVSRSSPWVPEIVQGASADRGAEASGAGGAEVVGVGVSVGVAVGPGIGTSASCDAAGGCTAMRSTPSPAAIAARRTIPGYATGGVWEDCARP